MTERVSDFSLGFMATLCGFIIGAVLALWVIEHKLPPLEAKDDSTASTWVREPFITSKDYERPTITEDFQVQEGGHVEFIQPAASYKVLEKGQLHE